MNEGSDFVGRTGSQVFHEVDLAGTDDEMSVGVVDANEDGIPSVAYNYSRPYVPMSPQYIPHRGLVRYSSALKHLIPVRRKRKVRKALGIDSAGFLSLITYSWMTKYVCMAYKRGLTVDDVPLCSSLDCSDLNAQRLELMWQEELVNKGPIDASFGRVVWKFCRTRVAIACVAFALSCIMGFLSPTIFMRKLLEFAESPDASQMNGVTWALALTASELMRTLFFALCWCVSYRTATRIRAACLALIYRKIIRLHSIGHKSIGELINLYASDGPRLFNMIVFGPMVIGGPMVAVCGLIYILYLLGPWALLGMLAFVLFYPIQFGLSRLTGYYRGRTVKLSDSRVRWMTEILGSIKLIKMYAWESFFTAAVEDVRAQELKEQEKTSYCQSISISMAPTVPVISGIVTFLAHVLSGGNLTAAQAFTTLSFITKFLQMALRHVKDGFLAIHFGIITLPRIQAFPLATILQSQIRTALNNLRYGSENIVDGKLAFRRIQAILLLEETVTHISHHLDNSQVINITDGDFAWDAVPLNRPPPAPVNSSESPELEKLNSQSGESDKVHVLHSINFSAKKGSLIGICGTVGSGKTSLLLACLGQLRMTSGQLSRSGKPAYVSQQAWIQNATLRDNILFGEVFDPKRYINVLYSCALSDDVNLLPGGDKTEIGERGINLSGGQKQRVSLARAVYSNRDVYFLDDPLSAVDTQVGSLIFEKCIQDLLGKKTVLLVTHQPQFLQQCDEILVMKEGRIVERGGHNELLARGREYTAMTQSSALPTQLQHRSENGKGPDGETVTESSKKDEEKKEKKMGEVEGKKEPQNKALMTKEEQLRGEIKAFAYHGYVNAAGGYLVCFLVVISIFVSVGSNAFSSYWLALWIKAGSGNTTIVDAASNATVISNNINDNPQLGFYMQVYAGNIGIIVLASLLRGVIFTKVTIRASKQLHRRLYDSVLASPMRYFETTPIGRLQNLFAQDMDEVDSRLPASVETMLQNIWIVMFSFLFITLVFPWFVVPLVVLTVLYYFISKVFRVAVRDLKRLENITRAPIFSCVSATVQGLSTIHAFSKENDFISQFSKVFDDNSTCMYLSCNAMRWMATRLDSISVAISCITALMVVMLKGEVAPALAGLALTYAAHISGVFQYTIRLMSETEARFISVERIQHNIETLQPEGGSGKAVQVPTDWPSSGHIKFSKVCLSYEKNLPDVLHSVSFTVKPGQKIGVVGRTGAGKSSLAVALFRLVELTSGKITVDGLDIAQVDLNLLRSRLSVIPQDPVLFSGTLRSNLDPFRKFKDDEVWIALRKTRLYSKVLSMEGQLEATVGDSGGNLSVGERQLVCLARALLRGSKILLLDEATASVDPETEAAVQATVEEEFHNCTVVTIAHRLSTVAQCDCVLVMDQGMVLESGQPTALLENPASEFSKMAAAVGRKH